MTARKSTVTKGPKIAPDPVRKGMTVEEMVDQSFLAYNAARLREACRLFVERMLEPDVTVGLTLSGALTPAGLGRSCLIPLLKSGFVDWMVSTGANLYHDTHFGIGLTMHQGRSNVDDVELRDQGIVRRLGNGGVHGDVPRCRRQARVALVTAGNGIDRVEDRDVDDGKGPARPVRAQLLPENAVLAGPHRRVVERIGHEQNFIPATDRIFSA